MIPLCKTENDFYLWCKQLVPKADADYKLFRQKRLDLHKERNRYDETLEVRRQLTRLRYLIDDQHRDFLERHLLGSEERQRTPLDNELYRDIFEAWCEVCFPEGMVGEWTVDNKLLGQKLRTMRKDKGIGICQRF